MKGKKIMKIEDQNFKISGVEDEKKPDEVSVLGKKIFAAVIQLVIQLGFTALAASVFLFLLAFTWNGIFAVVSEILAK